MKIAMFSDNFYPELSGISDSIVTLAKELAKKGHEIHFYAPKYSAKDYLKAGLPEQEPDLGPNIKFHRLFSFSVPSPTGQSRLVIPLGLSLNSIRKVRPDIIHSQLFFGVGLEALLAAKLNKIPMVGTNHTAITEFVRYLPIRANWFKSLALKYATWYYNCCDYVTAPSQAVFNEMIPNGFHKPHESISNPIDLITFSPEENKAGENDEIRKKFRLSESTVIYAGRLAEEKNIDVIIRAIALVKEKIPTITLALAGHGAAEESLKKEAEKLGVTKHMKFLGTLDKPTLAKAYRASKIFCIMSTSETQSMTLMQAMGCGLPVIGANARALPEYINKENGFVIEPGDHKTLANKIISLLQNADLAAELSRGSLAMVQKYSTGQIANRWEEVYKKIKGITKN